MKIKVKNEINRDRKSLTTIDIRDDEHIISLPLTDKEIVKLLEEIYKMREDLIEDFIYSTRYGTKIKILEDSVDALEDEIKELKEEIDDLEYDLEEARNE